jgi:CRISPR-associated protein Cas1
MRRHLNTIYVTSEDSWLRKDGANIVVEVEGVERGRVPMHLVDGVVSFARPGASPALMAACAENGIALSFLTPQGKFLARVEGARTGNVLLRRTQYRVADDPARAVLIARGIVSATSLPWKTGLVRKLLKIHAFAGSSFQIHPPTTVCIRSGR